MTAPERKLSLTAVFGVLLLGVTVSVVLLLTMWNQRRSHTSALPNYGQVPGFTLTNQAGAVVTLADLQGTVWVADIIFTRCPGPCLRMTRQMKELETELPRSSRARLVSLTTDPDFDTPAVLQTYAERFSADTDRWMFVTGSKQELANLAIQGLKLTAVETRPEDRQSPDDLFIHSTIFVVVDKRGQLRGTFETGGEGVDWAQSKRAILEAVQELERER